MVVLSLFRSPPAEEESWEAFDPILIESAEYSPEIARAIADVVPGLIGRDLSTVEIENFAGGETVFYRDLDERLEETDPRYDPFLRASAALFRAYRDTTPFEVLYAPVTSVDALDRRFLSGLLPASAFFLPDSPTRPVGVFLAVAAVICGILLGMARSNRFLFLVPALQLVHVVYIHGAAGLVQLGLLLPALLLFLEARRDGQQRRSFGDRTTDVRRLVPAALFALLGVSAALFGGALRGLFDLVLFAGLVAAVEIARFEMTKARLERAEHRFFVPVPIIHRPWHGWVSETYRRGLVAAPALAVVALFVVTVFGIGEEAHLQMPVPIAASERPAAPSTVSVDGYLAHRAFQKGLQFGRGFSVPERGETIDLERYVRDNGTVRSHLETVVAFDEAWFESVMAVSDARSLYLLIVDEGEDTVVEIASVPPTVAPRQSLRTAAVAVAAALIPGAAATRLRFAFSAGRFSLFMKRKRQEA